MQKQLDVRVLTDGKGIANYERYYLASSAYAASRPDVLKVIFEKLKETGDWVKKNPGDASRLLAPVWGVKADVVELANSRRSYDVRAVSPDNLAGEQKIADAFFAEGLLPKEIKTNEALIWSPNKQASAN